MSKYKVKHFLETPPIAIQQYKEWVRSRNHITLVCVNMVEEDIFLNVIITYMENTYEL